jgi:hypothetical protein
LEDEMVVSVSDIRVAPIGEDLSTNDLSLEILRGFEKMYRVDKKIATGAFFAKGEWAVLNVDGKAERPSTTPVGGSYLVLGGTDRFDARATGQVTLIMSHPVIVKTKNYDVGQSYNVGDYLTVKDLGDGESLVTSWGTGEPKHARVIEEGNGAIVFETLGGVE